MKYASFYYNTGDSTPFDENRLKIEEKLKSLRTRGLLQLSE